ncbi:hypothetical protein QAD02_022118 [Eretmocerus hayati]|uniref:Uncharacterized protein n=1 Tax=Eretmocerus hayati TaxID=131215 RepID=A0ACC2PSM9_9HYME|nr:hypothetical protein QAD02_022118 [Eretmocerus hayati]
MEQLRIFRLLLYKNYLIRKRHWKLGLFVEIFIPVVLFMLIQACRDFSASDPQIFTENTYYDINTKEELMRNINFNTEFYFVPQTHFTRNLMDRVRKCLRIPSDERVIGFQDEEEMIKKYTLYTNESPTSNIIAVMFNDKNLNITTKHLRYTIRTPFAVPNTLYNIDDQESSYRGLEYDFMGLPCVVQLCLDESFINMIAPNSAIKTKVSIQEMPHPPHVKVDAGDVFTRTLYCAFAVAAFLIPLCIETTYAADEKFIGINVLMEMNGVSNYLNILSWLVSGLTFSLSYITIIVVLFNFSFTTSVHPFLHHGNSFILWLVLLLHVGHLITFGIHIASYFSRPLFMMSGILAFYGGSIMLQKYSIKGDCHAIIPYFGIFFPNVLLFRAFQEVNNYESMMSGIKWSTLFISGDPVYRTAGSMGMIMIFSVIGTIFHFLMSIYIHDVHPGKYGVKKHPLYFLKLGQTKDRVDSDDEMDDYEYGDVDDKLVESVPKTAYTPGIQIRNLKKDYRTHTFNKSKVQALRGISVDFYRGQITALLGHNGAGKTTLMSVLTGMISPTTGTVHINGQNVKDDSSEVMKNIGLCPQENMLFPCLSVYEQLEFFALLKGKNEKTSKVKSHVNALLDKLKLFDKRNALPNQLSGGQKRRVCLGMAIIGDSNTLILDEPTSGMDPESRRDTWDIILKMRGQKTILISTHDMEEADILGDRIAIVHMGRLRSYGTPMFLKKLLGQGNMEVTLSTESWCDPQKIREEFDPKCQILNMDGGKLVLSIPYSLELPDSLDTLELKKKDLGITGMSVSLITLEQVFLKVTRDSEDVTDSCRPLMETSQTLQGHALFIQSAFALLKKKFSYTKKNLTTIGFLFLMPFLCILFMTMDYNISNDNGLIPMDLSMYGRAEAYFKTDNHILGQKYSNYVEKLGSRATNISSFASLSEAILSLGKKDVARYRNHLIAGAEFNNSADGNNIVKANAYYSSYATFGIPISINLLSNALIKSVVGDEYSISIYGQQLPHTLQSTPEDNTDVFATALLFIFFLFPTVALFVIHPLRESVSNMKHLQRMTGVSCFTYWGTMFVFDLFVLLILVFSIVIGFICMDRAIDLRMYRETEIGVTLLMLVLFSINVLPLVYLFSFIKKSGSTVITLLSLLPFGMVSIDLVMHIIIKNLSHYKFVKILRATQKRVFLLMPYISIFHAEVSFFGTATKNARCRRLPNILHDALCLAEDYCCELDCFDGKCKKSLQYFNKYEDDMSLEEGLTYLCITPIIYFGILALLEYNLIPMLLAKIRNGKYEIVEDPHDEQVKREKHSVASEITKTKNLYQAVETMETSLTTKIESNGNAIADESSALSHGDHANANYLFLVYELSKRYGDFLAVEEISFGVRHHECFGLLGVNGAGKSTTFKMITGECVPNSGVLYLGGKDYYGDRTKYLSQMGYCPQSDAIIRCLNAFDHLKLFARLRGIPEHEVDSEVQKWIDRINLNVCASQPSETYSGGNKRRLNIAMALIGNPNLVLLDEPTTGVDPAARRSLWNVIQSCQNTGQAIILTSHSMEECEALCNRLVIMVNGQLVCVGPCQELKQKFGAGYDIQMKLNPEKSVHEIDSIKTDMERELNCEIVDENSSFLMYHVLSSKTTWRRMYDVMSELRSKYECIDDFSVLSSSLEQLFLLFARTAKRPNNLQKTKI